MHLSAKSLINYIHELETQTFADQLWLRMRGQCLFVTGGSGLFGRWFLSAMVDANRRLGTEITAMVLTRSPDAFLNLSPDLFADGWVRMQQGNVLDFVFPKQRFSMVLHLAATSARETFAGEDALLKFKTLCLGTERVLQFAAEAGAEKLLFTSSGVTYDACPEGAKSIPESYRGAPLTTDLSSSLGQGKRTAEFLCAYYAQHYGFEFNIARCFSFVGPGLPLDLHYAIGNFIRDALERDVICISGDGMPIRSYLYLGDMVIWLLSILLKGIPGRIYNVGSDHEISIKNLAYMIRDLVCPEKSVSIKCLENQNIGNFNRARYVPDIKLAKSELDVNVWTSLEKAVLKTVGYANAAKAII